MIHCSAGGSRKVRRSFIQSFDIFSSSSLVYFFAEKCFISKLASVF